MQIRFDQFCHDQGQAGRPCQFTRPIRMIEATTPAEVPAALDALDGARAEGLWLAGYASYELGYVLEPKLVPLLPENRRLPLLRFGVYDGPEPAEDLPMGRAGRDVGLGTLSPRWDEARYRHAFEQVHDAIGAGDIYQANLTFPIDSTAHGDPAMLYAALMTRQPVLHGALVEQDGLPALLSRSPELFFRTTAAGRIETRPMKGTQPRSEDPAQDRANRDFLITDEKNNAENLMIVDLLRNDISRVARPGSVHVPELFCVESYATVHQMVSTVAAELAEGVQLSDILRALFPCGSITGAPKIRAMEILRGLEPDPRDIYCGTIGWAAPDGASSFNVAIRTLMVEDGQARLNVGGGVVWDSTSGSEYEEALWKARFAEAFQMEQS
ncbi:aminodeoxychorismate synthase component I [Aliiroseovarius crassostreae]|uniref:Aminodeoxychorismate synthase component I n=1 Tax=Aliiroseovarius crassostreae TaxID=154981 RepID=A0A9Q9LUF8_9RHOB|nr:aminodeoxychorismate synthase component I [Aliiroseovarius crassostreae]UWP97949.1 aminodeoxychorismate synthase component I [Aliiroseovarius crassostreae]